MFKSVDGTDGALPKLCKHCQSALRAQCPDKEDTAPRDCALISQYLSMAREQLPPGYDIFVKYTEIHCVFYIAYQGTVVAEHTHPKALIGEVLIRRSNPEWFDEAGYLIQGQE
jgi:hypothetical protein